MLEEVEPLNGNGSAIALPAILDLTAAAPLKEQLVASLDAEPSLAVDASGVQRITSPCLQVLLSAAKTAQVKGGTFCVLAPSQQFTDAVAVLALGGALGMEGQVQ